MKSISERVLAICEQVTNENVTEKQLISCTPINSLSFIEIVVEIETEFGFEIDDEDLDIQRISTVGDITKLVEKYIRD